MTIKRQCEILSVNRSSVYYEPKPRTEDERTVSIMHLIDRIHTESPTYGYRKITGILRRDILINRKSTWQFICKMVGNNYRPPIKKVLDFYTHISR
jgi:putative transposase